MSDDPAVVNAQRELERARARRGEITRRDPLITRLVASIEAMRAENNFAPRIERAPRPW